MFQPNSLPIRFLTKICDLILLNLFFVLNCATVIFSGIGLVALYTVTMKMVRRKEYAPLKDFLWAARDNFISAVPATILLFLDGMLVAYLRYVLYADALLLPPELFVLLTLAAVLLTALLSYLFPLLARFENTFSRHLGNAARLALANLPVTLLLTAVNLLPLLLSTFFPALLGVVFAFWMMFGFAAGAWVNSFYLNRIFQASCKGD